MTSKIEPIPDVTVLGHEVVTAPVETATTERIDKSLLDEPVTQKNTLPKFSHKNVPGYFIFQCYLGHMTYAQERAEKVRCIHCPAISLPLSGTQTCICSHGQSRHKGVSENKIYVAYCLDCGVMQGDDGERPRCESFNLSQ